MHGELLGVAWVPRLVSCRRWRRATLSGRSSFRSTKAPARILSTTLAATGGKADERIIGCALWAVVAVGEGNIGEIIASSSVSEGGLNAPVFVSPLDDGVTVLGAQLKRGTAPIAWGGGIAPGWDVAAVGAETIGIP